MTNNHQIRDYSAELDRKYGAVGTKEREQRINSSKSYVSRIERGQIIPSVSVFYRIINALGLRVDIVRPLA